MVSFFHELIAGGIGGGAGVFVGHPLDTVRVRLQNDTIKRYSGTLDCLRKTMSEESVRGLFRGLAPPLIGATAVNACLFFTYSAVESHMINFRKRQRHLKQEQLLADYDSQITNDNYDDDYDTEEEDALAVKKLDDSLLKNLSEPVLHAYDSTIFTAGCVAGGMSGFITTPVELFKCRLQVNNAAPEASAIAKMAKQMYQQGGFRGFFHGFSSTLIRDIPSFGVYYLSYHHFKHWSVYFSGMEENRVHQLVAGGTAGSASWLLCYPFDVIKCRIQTVDFDKRHEAKFLRTTRNIIRTEGFGPLHRGLGATIVRGFPVSAVTFCLYEMCLDFLEPNELH